MNIIITNKQTSDFHFLWECLKVLFSILWGNPSHSGSLCNLREKIQRKQVDKSAKSFNVADEFIQHVFTSHLIVRICTLLNINSPDERIDHPSTKQWLVEKSKWIASNAIDFTPDTEDAIYSLHRFILHYGFLYSDLRNTIRWEDGPQVIRYWKFWLPCFVLR